MKVRSLLYMVFLVLVPSMGHAQTEIDERALIEVKDGISIRQDSLFLLNLRFRMQNRLGVTSVGGDDLRIATTDFRVRRLRLRLDGYVLSRRLQYYIQLNFSRADLEVDAGNVPQPVRDAMVYYHFNRHFYFGVGQSKLPGNRQRVISSGNQQFPDRSIANGAFTLDRDFGLFAYWTLPLPTRQQWQLKGAVSSGDGRGAAPGNSGLAYTGRVEWLPFGAFLDKGDYSEGDLAFEPKPRLSFGASYSRNDRAIRTGGQLGRELYAPRSMNTFIADAILKYNGWALSGEYFDRRCYDPITMNEEGAVRFVPTGTGVNAQLSRCFPTFYEISTRYSRVDPAANTMDLSALTEEVLLGTSKYLNGHRIKLQTYLGYRWFLGNMALDAGGNAWTALFQVEFGI
ncbi:MAG: porin [Flavobacteriales bacterium]|nr:porin [Flavobacteriales bacterium]